jgi:1-acyl-sn-glycerol-3-phosphate acyltransferase
MKIFANISWFFATLIIFLALIFLILIFHFVPQPLAPKISAWIIRITIFFRIQKQGKEDPDANMILLNHQSDIDIAIMETSTKKDLAWVAKKELFDIPFFGYSLKLPKDIPVERESKTSLIKLIKAVKSRLDMNKTITMFPEGTRSSKGKMLPFKMGAKMVADTYKLRVQPVVIMQSAKYYDIKKFYYKPGRIKLIYLDSFVADKADENWLKNLRDKMQKVYDDELANDSSHR